MENRVIDSEGLDLEYVEAVLDGRVATTGRYGGGSRSSSPSADLSRRRRRRGGVGGGGQRWRRSVSWRENGGRRSSRTGHLQSEGRGQVQRRPQRGERREDMSMMMFLESDVGTGIRDPMCDTLDFKAFETIVKTQCLMMYGNGMLYTRCLDVLRPWELAKGMRECFDKLQDQLHGGDAHLCLHSCTQIASLSWLILTYPALPYVRCVLDERDQSSVGNLGGWMIAVVLLLQAMKESREFPQHIDIAIVCTNISHRSAEVIVQGLEHLSIAVKSVSECCDRPCCISFDFQGITEMDAQSSMERACDRFEETLTDAIDRYCPLTDGQKVAFLMGMHPRVGRMSPVHMLHRDIVERIFGMIEIQRLSIEFVRS